MPFPYKWAIAFFLLLERFISGSPQDWGVRGAIRKLAIALLGAIEHTSKIVKTKVLTTNLIKKPGF